MNSKKSDRGYLLAILLATVATALCCTIDFILGDDQKNSKG